MTPLWTSKSCPEARVLPEGVRVAVEVEVAETAARLRQRDVRGEIRADDIADVEDVIHTALNHRADLRDLSPVIVPLSYDLSALSAPPSPTGFIQELDAIRK